MGRFRIEQVQAPGHEGRQGQLTAEPFVVCRHVTPGQKPAYCPEVVVLTELLPEEVLNQLSIVVPVDREDVYFRAWGVDAADVIVVGNPSHMPSFVDRLIRHQDAGMAVRRASLKAYATAYKTRASELCDFYCHGRFPMPVKTTLRESV